PSSLDLEVVETERATPGATRAAITKPARPSNGVTVQIRSFINQCDLVRVGPPAGKCHHRATQRRSGRGPRAVAVGFCSPLVGRQGVLRIFVRGSPCCVPAVSARRPPGPDGPSPDGPDGPRPASDCSAVAPPATNRIQSRPHVPHN